MPDTPTPIWGMPRYVEGDVPNGAAQDRALANYLDSNAYGSIAMQAQGTLALRGAATPAGRRYLVRGDPTPAENGIEYIATGTTWIAVGVPDGTVTTAKLANASVTKAKLAAGIIPPAVTVLPAVPTDGDEVYFVADAANGVLWHLRYRAAAPTAYKWECLGGMTKRSFLYYYEQVPAVVGGTIPDPAHPGPSVTLPLPGIYDTWFGCEQTNVGGPQMAAEMYLKWKGAFRPDSIDPITGESYYNAGVGLEAAGSPSARGAQHVYYRQSYTDAPGDVKLTYSQPGTYVSMRYVSVMPVRVAAA